MMPGINAGSRLLHHCIVVQSCLKQDSNRKVKHKQTPNTKFMSTAREICQDACVVVLDLAPPAHTAITGVCRPLFALISDMTG